MLFYFSINFMFFYFSINFLMFPFISSGVGSWREERCMCGRWNLHIHEQKRSARSNSCKTGRYHQVDHM